MSEERSPPIGVTASRLLDPLTDNQQRMVELMTGAFIENAWEWPLFDYVEGRLDDEGIDAWSELARLPQQPGSGYSAAWWDRAGNVPPEPEKPVGLTVLGLHHAEAGEKVSAGLVPLFLSLVGFLARWRRERPLLPTQARNLEVSSDEVIKAMRDQGFPSSVLEPKLLEGLLTREPATWGGGWSSTSGDRWTRHITRNVYRCENVETIEAYVESIVSTFPPRTPPPQPMTPSPFGLVGAIDYLDTVWRLTAGNGERLFRLHSAQRTALLAFPAQTADEFDSRLSGLGELLRSLQLPDGAPTRPKKRDEPLGRFQAYLKSLLPESQTRIERSIETLHHVLRVRDAGQHTAAGDKGAAALVALGIGYPPPTWAYGWTQLMAHTIEALDALREELATLAP
jgi:hypothetical protein